MIYIPCTPIGVYRGIHNFLIFALKHRLWVLVRTGSDVYPQGMFSAKIRKLSFFYIKIFIFTVVKYRCILHGHIFIMQCCGNAFQCIAGVKGGLIFKEQFHYDKRSCNMLQFFTAVKMIVFGWKIVIFFSLFLFKT